MSKATKRAMTFLPPSQRAAAKARMESGVQAKTGVQPIASVPKAPRALAHPANVRPQHNASTVPATSTQGTQVASLQGVSVVVRDEEAVVVLGALLDSRDKALKSAETATDEKLADQLLAKAVLLETLCERVGRAFVERRMAAIAK